MTEPTQPLFTPPVSSVVARSKKEQEVLTQIERMPALPKVVLEVMRIVIDAKSAAKDLQSIIRQDQVLIGRILKLVNSSFYIRARRITNIQEAVVALGYNTIRTVAAAASASKMLNQKMEGYAYADLGLWKHSHACAVASKILAAHLRLGAEMEAEVFLGGLLHDIGKIILDGFLRDCASAFRAESAAGTLTRLEVERKHAGFDHTDVGLRIAKRWNFPKEVDEVIRLHHAPGEAAEFPKHVAIVHLANLFINSVGIGLPAPTAAPESPSPKALQNLGLHHQDVPALHAELAKELDNIRALCDTLSA